MKLQMLNLPEIRTYVAIFPIQMLKQGDYRKVLINPLSYILCYMLVTCAINGAVIPPILLIAEHRAIPNALIAVG